MSERDISLDLELLRACATVVPALTDVSWVPGEVSGNILLDATLWPAVAVLEEHGAARFRAGGRTLTLQQLREQNRTGEKVHVDINPPRTSEIFFAEDIDDLISHHDFHRRVPTHAFLRSQGYLYEQDTSTQDGMPAAFSRYLSAIQLVSFLVSVADHTEKRTGRLWVVVLTKSGKLEIPVEYGGGDLRDLPGLDALRERVLASPHEDEKMVLLKAALAEVLGQVAVGQRFAVLLDKYEIVKEKFTANYELYVSEFSFEDDREKLEEKKREYLLKLNSALADIHTKLIAIPAAVVLVGGQMKAVTSPEILLTNIVLLSGAVVFAVLMFMITRNQNHSLTAVRREYVLRRQRLELELPKLFAQVHTAFEELEERFLHQRRLLVLINYLIGAGLLFSCWMFVYFYPPLRDHLASVARALTER